MAALASQNLNEVDWLFPFSVEALQKCLVSTLTGMASLALLVYADVIACWTQKYMEGPPDILPVIIMLLHIRENFGLDDFVILLHVSYTIFDSETNERSKCCKVLYPISTCKLLPQASAAHC